MGNGVNISHSNHVSTIDMCGQKVLGMSGSLLNYINTGNPGPALSNDSFNKAKKPEIKEKKKTNFGAIIKGSIVALSVVAGGCLIFANRNKLFKGDLVDNIKKFFTKINANKLIVNITVKVDNVCFCNIIIT